MNRLALQAGLCYNRPRNIVVSEGVDRTAQTLIHLYRRCIVDTLPSNTPQDKLYKRSPEARAKMSASAKLRANTPEGRARMSKAAKAQVINPFAEKKHTEETRAIIKAKRAQQVMSQEHMEKAWAGSRGKPAWNRGMERSQEEKDQISSTLISMSAHLSQKAKERYARETDEQHEKRLAPWIEASQKKENTSIEVFVAQWLDMLGIEYEAQKQIGYYVADFYIPSRNTVLDVHGCHWHGCEQCGYESNWHIQKRYKDKRRTTYLRNKGYTVQVVWEHKVRHMMQYVPKQELIV